MWEVDASTDGYQRPAFNVAAEIPHIGFTPGGVRPLGERLHLAAAIVACW